MRDHQYRRSDSNIRKSVNETDKGWVKRQKEIQRKCYIKSQRCRIGRRKISTTSNAGERSCKIKHWKVVTGFCNKIIDDLRDGKFDQGLRCTLVTVNWRAARRWSELIKYRLLVFWFGFCFFFLKGWWLTETANWYSMWQEIQMWETIFLYLWDCFLISVFCCETVKHVNEFQKSFL